MQTIPHQTAPLNRRSASQSASWRRMRQAQGRHTCAPLRTALRTALLPSRRPHVSVPKRALASLVAALAPVALAGLLLHAGVLTSAPLAQTHAAPFSSTSQTSAVDLAALADMRAQTSAAVSLHYRRGYSVQGSWLCYGWSSGAYHCTQHWYRASSGAYVSRNPGWVPSEAAETSASSAPVSFSELLSAAPSGISQWAYTGRASYPEPGGNTQGYSWGWCTAGAAQFAHDYVGGLGNADQWTRNAAARGMATGSTPRVGATVVYAPGVQGASGGGHVAHVAAVYGNGWFLSEDVNFFWNGGGWGRVSFRYAHAGAGVSFIY